MARKSQSEIITDLQNNPDFVILNNPLSAPKFIRKLGKKQDKSLTEIHTPKLFYDIISRITPEHLQQFEEGKDTVTLTLPIGAYLKATGSGNSKNLYRHVIDCIDLMQTTQVKWKDGEKEIGTAIITHYEYHPGQGKVEVVLYKEFVKQVVLVTQDEHFSFLKQYLYQLQNAQALKLFPFFVSWRNKGMVQITLKQFREKFGYNTVGYSRFNNIKTYILDPAIAEISAKTNLKITYKLLGENLTSVKPRVIGLQFFIKEEKVKPQQLPQQAAEYIPFEKTETTLTQPKPTIVQAPKSKSPQAENPYLSDILRVFHIFEPENTDDNIKGFLSAFDDPKAVLEACLYAEQERLKKHEIKNFRGYLVAGIRNGLGFGTLEQRAKDQAKAQQVEQKKTAQADKTTELENLLKEAEILRGYYRADINAIIKPTTDDDKENVADIIRARNSIFASKTLEDFRDIKYISTYITTFIATYPRKFADVQRNYQEKFEVLAAKIKKIDPAKAKNLFHY
jgi:hypothetical protein